MLGNTAHHFKGKFNLECMVFQARCDFGFGTVRCDFKMRSGVWFYEVQVVTDGGMWIGWATNKSECIQVGPDIEPTY